MGAIRVVFEHGPSVPDDVAIIGNGNVPISALMPVALITVDDFPSLQGENAVRLIMRRLGNPSGSVEQVILHSELIVRESCGGMPRPSRQV